MAQVPMGYRHVMMGIGMLAYLLVLPTAQSFAPVSDGQLVSSVFVLRSRRVVPLAQSKSDSDFNKKNGRSSPLFWSNTTTAPSPDEPILDLDESSSSIYTLRDLVHHRPEHLGRNGAFVNKNSDKREQQETPRRSDEAAAATPDPGSLGDIMSSGLVTVPRLPLRKTYGFSNPLDRMVLTANGNLQRLISSYYDSAVSVLVDRCDVRPPLVLKQQSQSESQQSQQRPAVVWDRVVHLTVLNQTFCTATSVITVRDPLCVTLVESGRVGLGQLFRYLDLLPEFSLINAGRYPNNDRSMNNADAGFWREYTLECAEVSCRIHEEFVGGLWELVPQ